MLLETDFKIITNVNPEHINLALDACLRADWNNAKYNRYESSLLEGRLCTLPYESRNELQKTYTPDQEDIITAVQPLVNEVSTAFPNLVKVRGEVVNLLPGKQLDLHIDIYWFHKYSKRIHIPICTNDKCAQVFEDREHHLEVGKMYEINNRILHSAYNKGTTPRIHLIIDLMEENRIKEARNTKGLFLSRI